MQQTLEMKNGRSHREMRRERDMERKAKYLSIRIDCWLCWMVRKISHYHCCCVYIFTSFTTDVCIRYCSDWFTLMSCGYAYCVCVYFCIAHWEHIVFDYSRAVYYIWKSEFLSYVLAAAAVDAVVVIVAILNHNSNCYFMWFDGVQAIRHWFLVWFQPISGSKKIVFDVLQQIQIEGYLRAHTHIHPRHETTVSYCTLL